MRTFLAALLLLLSAAANAMPLHGGGTSQACAGLNSDGGPYNFATTCTFNADGHLWAMGPLYNGSSTTWEILSDGSFAEIVGDSFGRIDAHLFWLDNRFPLCGSVWQRWNTGWTKGFADTLFNTFTNTTTSTNYDSLGQVVAAAGANASLTVAAIPSQYGNCWPETIFTTDWNANGITLNLGSGFAMDGTIDILATGISILGNASSPATVYGQVRARDNSTNPTFKNFGIQPNDSGACGSAGSAASGLETGAAGIGTITISGVTAQGCGGGGAGQDHNFYLSSPVNGDANNNVQGDHITSLNVVGGGWLFKTRPGGQNTTNTLTQIELACTNNQCAPNGALDIPCGGKYNITHFVIEVNGQVTSQTNWYAVRIGEEIYPNSIFTGCDNTNSPPNASNVITFDTGYFIWDGPCPGPAPEGAGKADIVCAGGSTCSLPGVPSWSPTITVKNSKIVSDPSGCTLVYGNGITDGGGNTFYASRTAAGLGAWPALPTIP